MDSQDPASAGGDGEELPTAAPSPSPIGGADSTSAASDLVLTAILEPAITAQPIITIPEIGLTEIDGEPRARDIDVADRLGYSDPTDIRPLIERHRVALEGFGAISPYREEKSGRGRKREGVWLTEAQALYIGSKSDTPNANAVLSMLIRVFIAWRRGHLVEAPAAFLDEKTKRAIGGIVKDCTTVVLREQLGPLLDSMVAARLAEQSFLIRQGRTAGEIWRANGFPRMKITAWFSNRLVKMGCQIEGKGLGELGGRTARLFDPDRAANWLENGGRALVNDYVSQRRGQTVLRFSGAKA